MQAARVSYGAGTKTVREDKGLINYLMKNWHTSPFEQVGLTFHCKMPIFVARQWVRHRTARLNEISGRYSIMKDEFYVPSPAEVTSLIPGEHLASSPPPLPEVGEIDLIRHYTNLSARNMSIDTNFYPLGSCTMKYNPKRHERLAGLSGFADLHPLQDDATTQGMLQLLYEMQQFLAEISGLPAVTLPLYHGEDGLPLSVQLIGRPLGEGKLLSLATQLEAAVPWADRLPQLAEQMPQL